MLIFIVGAGGTLPNQFGVFARHPAIQSGLQSISFGSHESGCPQKRLTSGHPHVRPKVGLARARQNDELALSPARLTGEFRQLKTHPAGMTHINDQDRLSGDWKTKASFRAAKAN